ncbi:DUF1493 family protein [Cronobacter malonaticus]|uniref:DUF1493 family protein n=1 Tax=Cronobacter malonaticus TaxID=413503 RepID=UPI00289625B8|nr:DUF1493 family protein [Cronobacter malonaticus]ELY6243718.1 DUF1493 family protein [Cronobacter universalis]ELY5940993.1 DUF1493 family protein [Cronobacter malonaticus]ELY6204421.1 DUF1493 family protein [Cronobacter malonaticus]ELY6260354.1 DUF1493 family protein [Cronobacter malonaticus]MDT3559816.1 DUF1493 family protein [Cronobacter malonaticus]
MKTVSDEAIQSMILKELPLVTSFTLKKQEPDLDSPLQEIFEVEDIAEMAQALFSHFGTDHSRFDLAAYFPWKTQGLFSRKPVIQDKPPLTIRMFVESVKAGRWLYE